MSIDELTFEVHKLYAQKPIDIQYFTQIHEVIRDHASRISIMSRYMKAEIAQVKSDATQNATLAVDNDGRLKQGFMELEKQVNQNGAELRADVQAAVQTIALHPNLASAAGPVQPEAQEIRTMRAKLEEIGARTERDIKTVQARTDGIM